MVTVLRILKLWLLKQFWHNIIIGKEVIIDFNVRIHSMEGTYIRINTNTYLRGIVKGYQAGMCYPTTLLADVKGARIEIGKYCRINGAYIHAQKSIVIGDNCVIAANVNIIDTNGHVLRSFDRTKERDLPEEIVIGKNVWIGLNAIILKGTKIGDNSVISAGSVVRGEFPDNSLITGNPAKLVKIIVI